MYNRTVSVLVVSTASEIQCARDLKVTGDGFVSVMSGELLIFGPGNGICRSGT